MASNLLNRWADQQQFEQFRTDPSRLGRDFKTYGFDPSQGARGTNLEIAQWVMKDPALMAQLGLTPADLTTLTEGRQLSGDGGYQDASYSMSPAMMQALQGYSLNRTGAEGLEDGRSWVVRDAQGNAVQSSRPFTYDPAGETMSDMAKVAAAAAAMYGGAQLAGGGGFGGLGGIAAPAEGAFLGAMPTLESVGLGGAIGAGGGAAAGASLLGGAMPTLGMGGIDAVAGLTGGGSLGSFGAGTAAAGGGMFDSVGGFLNSLGGNSLVNLGGNLLNGYIGSKAAGKASDAQLRALMESNALQKYMYDTTRNDWAPYREAGTDALGQIQNLLQNPGAIKDQPDYQFGLNEGTNALENSASARGMTYSGQQAKALQKYGNDYAGSKLNESYNRLAGIAGIGQQSTSATQAAGSNYANQAGQGLQQMGNARASGYMGQANAWGNAFGNTLNNYNQQWANNQFGLPPFGR